MKRVISKLPLIMLLVMLMVSFTTTVFAMDLDGLNSGQEQSSTESSEQGSSSSSSNGDALTDYLKGYKPITDENMASASQYANPLTNILGTFTGFIVMLVSAGIFAVTALDLMYIGLPFTRSTLNPQPAGGGGGMGMMGGGVPQAQKQGLRRRWISDEALACVSQAEQPQGGGMSPMGGMGMGIGGMGMMSGEAPQQKASTKSVILAYLKKRTFFLVIFTLATILLTSSIFTDCGINLAQLSFKIIEKFNQMINGVQI